MINQVGYDINTLDGPVHLTIIPVNQLLPGDVYYSTGVYKLSDGVVGMGDISFNEDMSEWTYDGIGELTYEEAAEVAEFIKYYKDPEGADPDLLQ
ncbi:hypothetical protein [Mucilaginibacter gotjawali]|uniref:Uncharacterized protein n=2 Tax=Mucilaginibacter gotjawali TaxID=1550579 RepID=A0A839SP03_9SPHI|nr:hypothetical protein [Mucilaginibacter gotjawali]MBB3058219.1 hypothetical protein [Mucilaginibacter gotjawali]BAU54825.1 hypothetical protein MgSA37_03003 [Mucilaginibacter gotjawali]